MFFPNIHYTYDQITQMKTLCSTKEIALLNVILKHSITKAFLFDRASVIKLA